jgi:hypothetical protein
MHVNSALSREKQEDSDFQDSMGYMAGISQTKDYKQ